MTLEIHVSIPVRRIAQRLIEGYRAWGGGRGVESYKEPGVIGPEVYRVTFPLEDGCEGHADFRTAYEAVWDYLRRVDGNVHIHFTRKERP